MVHRSTVPSLALAGLAMTLAACGSSHGDNAAPRLSTVPAQSTSGDAPFSIDLASYVTDREAGTLTYTVSTGGGSFAGSIYTNTFDTMGDHTVEFSVTDGAKTTNGTFVVRVTEANFAVVREDNSGLLLLDTRTNSARRVAGSVATPSLAAGLSTGRLAYQLAAPGGAQLWIHDPLTRTSTRLAPNGAGDVTYRAKTSDGKVVYSVGAGNALSVWLYNPTTGVTRDLSQGSLSTLTVLVNSSDLVFYEIDVNGQADIYAYEPSTDDVFAVGTATTDEQLLAVTANGGVVFSRIGSGGEHDLFYYRTNTGLVEVGSDVTGIATWDKTWNAVGSASQVVFSAVSGSVSEIYAWNPANGQTANLSASVSTGAFDVFAAMGAGNEVVWNRVVSGSEADAYFYDVDAAAVGTVRNGSDISEVLGVAGDGTTAYAFVRPSGTTSSVLAVSLVASPATATWAASGTVATTLGVLANGDVVARRSDGTRLALFDASAGTWGTPITGTGLAFAGAGLDTGDFVYTSTVSSQVDLSMWDASAGNSVVVSDTVGDDTFQAATLDGTILFTRVASGRTNQELFAWNGTTETQLTDVDGAGLRHDHTVLGSYVGAR